MRFCLLFLLLSSIIPFAGVVLAAPPRDRQIPLVATTDPKTPEDERKCFHLPPGFEAQLVAAEPNVRKPININFDDRGRLWVTESIEYPFPAAEGAKMRDSIRILEDFNDAGLAGTSTTFTDGLNIPIGVLPVPNGAIAFSIPKIYRITDSTGGDHADKREVLLGTYGYKDTHGLTGEFSWGFDGWVYACHGFTNTSKVEASDGSVIEMQSGSTYRFKPDGSRVEAFARGQVNPFGLAFDPLGNLYSCDCHSRPIYQLLRGAFYPSFGKPHDGIGFAPEMMTHSHGSTGIAGITYYAADHFPPEYRDTIFIGNVITNRINNDRLERHGSTYKAIEQLDFLKSDDPWFRPVDIKLGPDGALYVADFYNRIIGHYEVPLTHPGRDRERGRIWRIVYRGPDGKGVQPRQPRPDWNKATVAELVEDLAHPNLTVRMKATNQLVERGKDAAGEPLRELLRGKSNPFQRMHGPWVLERCNALDDDLLTAAIKDSEAGVRVHALRVLAERAKLTASQHREVIERLKDSDAFVQRVAVEVLGRHPEPDDLRALLDLHHAVPADDTHLLHMVRMSLRDQLLPGAAWAKLPLKVWNERDARAVADVAPGVPSAESAVFLIDHLNKIKEGINQVRFVRHCARYLPEEKSETVLEYVRSSSPAANKRQLALFQAYQQGTQARAGKLSAASLVWSEDLTRRLVASADEQEVLGGIELCGSLKLEKMRGLLESKAGNAKVSEAQRLAALNALVAIEPAKSVEVLARTLDDPKAPIELREKSAGLLGGINQPKARAELLRGLTSAPGRLQTAIAAGLAGSKAGAENLLEAVATGKASARILQERQVERLLAIAGIPDLNDRVAKLTKGLPTADQRLQQLALSRKKGFEAAKTDRDLGAKVFETRCAICHQLANKGTKIGPELDGIGVRGLDRLIEDILDSNRNVDQAFRSNKLILTNGKIMLGLLLREEGETLVMADDQGKEVLVPKSNIEERSVSPISPMPANLVELIPEADFYHLLAFLLEQTKKK